MEESLVSVLEFLDLVRFCLKLEIPEREAFNYREHLVDLTRYFPGFEYNNELTEDGADMLESGDAFF